MTDFLQYLLISNVSLVLFWLTYRFWLRGNTHHALNRIYLLSGTVLSLLLPCMPFGRMASEQVLGVTLPEIGVGSAVMAASDRLRFTDILLMTYMIGVGIATAIFLRSLLRVYAILRSAQTDPMLGSSVLRSPHPSPFSFFSFIHLPQDVAPTDLPVILEHERWHVRLGHSYDALWINLLRIVFWFNPLLIRYQQNLQEVHEFQADACSSSRVGTEQYIRTQLDHVFRVADSIPFIHPFNTTNLKNRVAMMYSEKSSNRLKVRYLLTIPLVAAIGLMVACTETPADAVQQEAEKVFKEVDVMPEFPGGMQELVNYVSGAVQYPEAAKNEGIEGKVFVQFVVDDEGKVGRVEVVKGVRDDLDAEAVRVVSEMPDWTPGKQKDRSVNVEMILPISYKL